MQNQDEHGRAQALADVIASLRQLALDLGDIRPEIERFSGLVGRLAIEVLDRNRLPTHLRRHEVVTVPETLQLLDRFAGLRRSGVSVPVESLKPVLIEKAQDMARDLAMTHEFALARLAPGLDLDREDLQFDGGMALQELGRRIGRDLGVVASRQGPHHTPFLDFSLADLPEARQQEISQALAETPSLKNFSADEVVTLCGLVDLARRIRNEDYGILRRRRPLVSKVLRSARIIVPRLGIILLSHPKSARVHSSFEDCLGQVLRVDRFLHDLGAVCDQDDDVDHDHICVQGARAAIWRAHLDMQHLLRDLKAGRSAWRFPSEIFDLQPGPNEYMTGVFLAYANSIRVVAAPIAIGSEADRIQAIKNLEREEARPRSGSFLPEWMQRIFSRVENSPEP